MFFRTAHGSVRLKPRCFDTGWGFDGVLLTQRIDEAWWIPVPRRPSDRYPKIIVRRGNWCRFCEQSQGTRSCALVVHDSRLITSQIRIEDQVLKDNVSCNAVQRSCQGLPIRNWPPERNESSSKQLVHLRLPHQTHSAGVFWWGGCDRRKNSNHSSTGSAVIWTPNAASQRSILMSLPNPSSLGLSFPLADLGCLLLIYEILDDAVQVCIPPGQEQNIVSRD